MQPFLACEREHRGWFFFHEFSCIISNHENRLIIGEILKSTSPPFLLELNLGGLA